MSQCVWTVVSITLCMGAIGALSLVRIAGICSREDERWANGAARPVRSLEP